VAHFGFHGGGLPPLTPRTKQPASIDSAETPMKLMATAIMLLALASTQSFALTHEQSQAKIKGIELYNQYKAISAIEFLKIAADGGDDEALYYLGESIRKNNRYLTQEAEKAYEESAKKAIFIL
jgi:hypothetical protein